MASVIRIKRRRNDDPAEALLLSNKKSRVTDPANDGIGVESVLEFAGTLDSKDASISKHIKEAIRRKKIHKEMHPHYSDKSDRSTVLNLMRKQKAESSHNSRYKITFNRRALDLDNLDDDKDLKDESLDSQQSSNTDRLTDIDNKENSLSTSCGCGDSGNKVHAATESGDRVSSECHSSDPGGNASDFKSPKEICGAMCNHGHRSPDKVFCLIDVERESEAVTNHQPTSNASGITMNGVPMKQVTPKVPIAEESDDYVYDLYFTHTRLGHIQDEAVLTVEALCNDFLYDERNNPEGGDFVYDDDDDSNDEGNWRNDYPDEDPHFFENAETDYDFENNMKENLFDGDDEGDLLSYWMSTRCKLDVDCNEFKDSDEDKNETESDEEAGAEVGLY